MKTRLTLTLCLLAGFAFADAFTLFDVVDGTPQTVENFRRENSVANLATAQQMADEVRQFDYPVPATNRIYWKFEAGEIAGMTQAERDAVDAAAIQAYEDSIVSDDASAIARLAEDRGASPVRTSMLRRAKALNTAAGIVFDPQTQTEADLRGLWQTYILAATAGTNSRTARTLEFAELVSILYALKAGQ